MKKNTDLYTDTFFPRVDVKEKLLYCCPFCRFNTEEPSDIHYHIVGYHRVLQEFFNEY